MHKASSSKLVRIFGLPLLQDDWHVATGENSNMVSLLRCSSNPKVAIFGSESCTASEISFDNAPYPDGQTRMFVPLQYKRAFRCAPVLQLGDLLCVWKHPLCNCERNRTWKPNPGEEAAGQWPCPSRNQLYHAFVVITSPMAL
jgi:hypothetical protein